MTPSAQDGSAQGDTDRAFMARALGLAARWLGKTAPNPAVGCVITDGAVILAEAATGAGGRPHAEEQALALLSETELFRTGHSPEWVRRKLAVYVTLEPCAARSLPGTMSCAERLAALAPGRVLIATLDPNFDPAGERQSRVADMDHARRPALTMLRKAGALVETGLLEAEAIALNLGFFTRVRTGRPLVAIDSRTEFYDGMFTLAPRESFEEALIRMGKAGLTRVCAAPGTALAAQLLALGLVTPGHENVGP